VPKKFKCSFIKKKRDNYLQVPPKYAGHKQFLSPSDSLAAQIYTFSTCGPMANRSTVTAHVQNPYNSSGLQINNGHICVSIAVYQLFT